MAAKAKGVSYFKNLEELNQKESPRLIWGAKILKEMGIKSTVTKKSIKIYGNPYLKINKKIPSILYIFSLYAFLHNII